MSATLSIRPRLVNTIDRPLYGSIFCAHFDFIMGTLGRLFPAYWYNNWYNAVVRIKEGTAPTPCGRMARPPGLEPGTLCLEGRCSIQLSYGRTMRDVSGAGVAMQVQVRAVTRRHTARGRKTQEPKSPISTTAVCPAKSCVARKGAWTVSF